MTSRGVPPPPDFQDTVHTYIGVLTLATLAHTSLILRAPSDLKGLRRDGQTVHHALGTPIIGAASTLSRSRSTGKNNRDGLGQSLKKIKQIYSVSDPPFSGMPPRSRSTCTVDLHYLDLDLVQTI